MGMMATHRRRASDLVELVSTFTWVTVAQRSFKRMYQCFIVLRIRQTPYLRASRVGASLRFQWFVSPARGSTSDVLGSWGVNCCIKEVYWETPPQKNPKTTEPIKMSPERVQEPFRNPPKQKKTWTLQEPFQSICCCPGQMLVLLI